MNVFITGVDECKYVRSSGCVIRNQGVVFLEELREDTDTVVFKGVSRTDRRSGQRLRRCK